MAVARGGSVASDPDAVSWSSNRVDLVAQGMDNTLQHLYWNGSAWSWESLGEYP